MKCYFLQGTLGIMALTGIAAVTILIGWAFMNIGDVLESKVKLPNWVEMIGKTMVAIVFCFLLAIVIWQLGGEVLHSWFRWCTA